MRPVVAILIPILFLAAHAILPGQVRYDDFSNTAGLNLVGAAAVGPGNSVRLTPSQRNQVGAVWASDQQLVGNGFVTAFTFTISAPGGLTDGIANGGDGFAFVIQNDTDTAIGYAGGSIGYDGIPKSIAVEFDTWDDGFARNGDPNGNHVSINTRGDKPNSSDHGWSITSTTGIPNISDGNVHRAVVQYSNKVLSIFLDGCSLPVLEAAVDLNALLKLNGGRAWVGFTAATLSAWENHDIRSWRLAGVGTIPQDTVVLCNGDSATLRVPTVDGDVTWSTGARTPSIVVRNSGVYSVSVRENMGCRQIVYTRQVVVRTVQLAHPDIQVSRSPDLCEGESVTLDAGVDAPAYLWSTGERTRTITVAAPGTYFVDVYAPGCTDRSDPLEVRVRPAPKPVIRSIGPIVFCSGDSTTLDAGSGYASYLWSTGDTSRFLRVVDSASYWVRVTDSAGCSGTSAPLLVRVVRVPQPSIVVNGSATVCEGDSVVLEASIGYNRYEWSTGDTGQAHVVRQSGQYWVRVFTAEGCFGTSAPFQVIVQAAPLPVIGVQGATSLCNGDSVVLRAPAGQRGYLWSTGATADSIVVRASGSYTVEVTDTNGCRGTSPPVDVSVGGTLRPVITAVGATSFCQGDSLRLDAEPGYAEYRWNTGATSRSITVVASGSYDVSVRSSGGCVGTSPPIVVTVHPLPAAPVVTESGGVLMCTPAATYQWLLNGAPIPGANSNTVPLLIEGDYTVAITDSNGCAAVSAAYSFAQASTAVSLSDVSARPGEPVLVVLRLDSATGLTDGRARQFNARVRFNRTLLLPTGATPPGVIDAGDRVITIAGERPPGVVAGELARLEFLAMLGDAATTPLLLEHFEWVASSVPATTGNGTFSVLGLCTQGGTRLIDATGATALKSIRPNPASGRVEITSHVAEQGLMRLVLVDRLGRQVCVIAHAERVPGTYVDQLETRSLPAGVYVCVLGSATTRATAPLVIVR